MSLKKQKQIKVLSITTKVEQVGHSSKHQHGGVVDLFQIFLITRTSGVFGGTPAIWLPARF